MVDLVLSQDDDQIQDNHTAIENSKMGLDSSSDLANTQETAAKNSGAHALGASATDAPSANRAVMLTIARDVDAVSEIRHGQIVLDEAGDAYFTIDDGGTLGAWSKVAVQAGINAFASGTTIGDLTLSDGVITSSSGAISFGNENLTTTGSVKSNFLRFSGNATRPVAWDTNAFMWSESGVGLHIDSFKLEIYTGASETLALDIDQNQNTTLQGNLTVVSGQAVVLNLPTSSGASGTLWNDSGTVKVS